MAPTQPERLSEKTSHGQRGTNTISAHCSRGLSLLVLHLGRNTGFVTRGGHVDDGLGRDGCQPTSTKAGG